jgi:hypothetical protein
VNLRLQAQADLDAILGDTASGFGWPITVTSPDNVVGALVGLSSDIGHMVDLSTGMLVAGRHATVALSIAKLTAAGLGIPKGIADDSSKPWVVTFADIHGQSWTFKVASAKPDRAIGMVTCELKAYVP